MPRIRHADETAEPAGAGFRRSQAVVSTCGGVRAAGIGPRSVLWLLHHAFGVVAVALSDNGASGYGARRTGLPAHFRVPELAKRAVGRETVRQLVMQERM